MISDCADYKEKGYAICRLKLAMRINKNPMAECMALQDWELDLLFGQETTHASFPRVMVEVERLVKIINEKDYFDALE
jgi:hypothetical protein